MKCFPTTDDFQLLIKNAFACAIHSIVCRHCKRYVWEFCYSLQSFHFVFSSHATCSPAYSKSCELQPKTLKSVTTLFIAFRSVVVVAVFSSRFSYFFYILNVVFCYFVFSFDIEHWSWKSTIFSDGLKRIFAERLLLFPAFGRSFILYRFIFVLFTFFLLGGMRPVSLVLSKNLTLTDDV